MTKINRLFRQTAVFKKFRFFPLYLYMAKNGEMLKYFFEFFKIFCFSSEIAYMKGSPAKDFILKR